MCRMSGPVMISLRKYVQLLDVTHPLYTLDIEQEKSSLGKYDREISTGMSKKLMKVAKKIELQLQCIYANLAHTS